jgi:glycosyltransferase involved in cell wall biosynthesis
MASLGYRVTLLPLTDAAPKQPETHLLTQMGAEILWGPIGARQLLEDRRDSYDIVLISRPHNALLVMDLVRETNPKARVIYDAEALWYRREQLRRRLGFRIADPRFETEEAELSLIRSADYVTAVSPTEQKLIQEKLGEKERVILLGHPHHVAPTQTPFENRHDLLFVAGFKSAPGPNDDAAIYFTKHLLPRIQEKIPDVRFIIGGSNPPESVKQLASDSVLVLGYVNNLKELYEKARVFVVPTRFAAGIMWKVTEAMSYGLPCVLSTVAAQGLEIRDGEEALIAVDDDDFVKKTAQLYQDRPLWTRTREHELEYVAKNCDPAATEKTLDDLLRRASQPVT